MHCFLGLHVQEPLATTILELNHNWQTLGYPPADFHKHTYPHITIVPPFDTDDVQTLIQGLQAVTGSFGQFDADYHSIDVFNRRIVHAAVASNGLIDLRAKLYEFGLGTFHYQDDHPVFHPHTTVAYMHEALTDDAFAKLKLDLEGRLKLPQHQEVPHIQLYGRERPGEDYQIFAKLKLKALA